MAHVPAHAVIPLSNDAGNADETPDDEKSPQQWVRFEEEDKSSGNNVATIVPTQTIQLESNMSVPHPLLDASEYNGKQCYAMGDQRSTPSPDPGFANPDRVSPGVSTSAAPTRPLRKSDISTVRNAGVSEIVREQTANNMHSVPLTEMSIPLHKHTNSHGVSHGFSNGDIIVNLLPVNEKCPWVTKAHFKPELVPEELMAQGLTLTVEDYVMAMQVLVNDVRFNMYIVCYKRVLILWIMLGFVILLSLLFSGVRGLALFGGGIVWLIVNAVGIFVCMWLKIKLYRMLEQCLASVNSLLYKHHILIGLDDRGKISCHKVNLIFVYFDVTYCIKCLKDMLENEEKMNVQALQNANSEARPRQVPIDQSRMDIDMSDIIITGSSTTTVSQKEKYAEKLFLRYSQRWVKEYIRKRLDLRIPLHPDGTEEIGAPLPPRHCATARCPCQYIEEHLRFKPLSKCSIRELFS